MQAKFKVIIFILLNFFTLNPAHADSAILCLSPISPNILTKIKPEKLNQNPNFFVKVDNAN